MAVGAMHGLIREEHSFGANPGSKDLARHLYTRMACGKVVIVVDKPVTLVAALRKQWLKLGRKVRKEFASTLNATRIYELNEVIVRMQTLRFTTKWPQDEYLADVYIVTVEQLLRWAPECRTLYVTCEIETEQLHLVTTWMPKGSLVVICKLAEQSRNLPVQTHSLPIRPSQE
jgi:hypothetical protein